MELPHLGKHCSVKTCNRLDFLPMKCDLCSAVLCKDHIKYDEHECPSSHRKKNIQIPVCPLCNKAVPLQNRDQSIDRAVSEHIDRDCKSDPALKNRAKVYTNKCSLSTCKQREAIQVKCDKCRKTYCLKHRFPDDHKCQGFENTGRTMNSAGAAAIERMKKMNAQSTTTQISNNAASTNDEDESLALAIKLSLNQTTQEDNDFLLAKALQESEQEEARRRQDTRIKTNG